MNQHILNMGKPGKRSVEFSSQLLKRFYYIEKEIMRTLGGYHININDWEVKKRIPLHLWQSSRRADALRARVLEMRYPRRNVDQEHEKELQTFMSILICCNSDAELLEGVFFVTLNVLLEAYEKYLHETDPLQDAPTVAFMKHFIPDIRDQLADMEDLYVNRSGKLPKSNQRMEELRLYLESIRWMLDLGDKPQECVNPGTLSVFQRPDYVPPLYPVRDPSFAETTEARYYSPPESNQFYRTSNLAGHYACQRSMGSGNNGIRPLEMERHALGVLYGLCPLVLR